MPEISAPSFPAGRLVHLGVCGSVAAYKALELMRLLQKARLRVCVVLTPAARRFISPLSFLSLEAEAVYTDMFAQEEGAPFGHLRPRAVADAFVVAPASATTLARLASGMADEMLAAQALAFARPLVLAPAMNPGMWANAATQDNVRRLKERGHVLVLPAAGRVACGEEGQGRLADLEDIFWAVFRSLCPQDLAGKTILLTMGPTREPWDGVRCWTNLSSGRMGAALATAAFLRGARVLALAGPGTPRLPGGVERRDMGTAREMFAAAKDLWPQADVGIFAAAVADFSPLPQGEGKFKKGEGSDPLVVEFSRNPDILLSLAQERRLGQKIMAFAAETSDLQARARAKLERKKADLIVGNLVGGADSAFAGENNTVFVLDIHGRAEAWPVLPKADIAWRLLDWLISL
ncbi:MAG: bifunctional phosphopantothenoylcysteine decarboxylase/phosphopantothenate--cysteine ligase CoaBC [Deltaproteobacteria bacterium]|jgi:phosphopantothenoylcysteine decarboxylase/phosphopantothenate--cysteine ligase|nr:bifunctional phosphopantothenoylcysteine decarboxylase/phosphopantothenate--cysteine ligase CoaBC [Deltaproteobacteria bacterium]